MRASSDLQVNPSPSSRIPPKAARNGIIFRAINSEASQRISRARLGRQVEPEPFRRARIGMATIADEAAMQRGQRASRDCSRTRLMIAEKSARLALLRELLVDFGGMRAERSLAPSPIARLRGQA